MFAASSGCIINGRPAASPAARTSGSSHPLIDAQSCRSAVLRFDRDQTIVQEGDTPRYCYQITSGCVRTVKLLDDGRRQIGEFLFAGDAFGWEGGGPHEFSVESVSPSVLQRFRLDAVDAQAASEPRFARRLHSYLIAQLRLARDRLVVLGRMNAAERVCSFLIEMQGRLAAPGQADFRLPMNRADIGDYLGLTLETVSRALTGLRQRGIIGVSYGDIAIRDLHALRSEGSLLVH